MNFIREFCVWILIKNHYGISLDRRILVIIRVTVVDSLQRIYDARINQLNRLWGLKIYVSTQRGKHLMELKPRSAQYKHPPK